MSREFSMTIEEARGLVSDRLLWPLVRDFLWDFAPQVHESWLRDMEWCKALVSVCGNHAIASSLMSSKHVKRYVLDVLGVEPCFHPFPEDDGSRIMLLSGATLESMVKWLGALAYADQLRCVTDGAAVRELKASLPGVYPEVFGYTAYFTGHALSIGDAKLKAQPDSNDVIAAGVRLLFSCFSDVKEALVKRAVLKLPKGFCGFSGKEKKQASALPAARKILKLKFPEVYKLCYF